jgi:group I intron endonuclease
MNSGIYKITNKVNGKFYIGSSKNIKERWKQHRSDLKSGSHSNPHLQNSYNKYGKKNFKFEIIETIDPIPELLLEREQVLLDYHLENNWEQAYNIAIYACSGMKGRGHTEEVKQLLSEKLSGENHPHYGKPVSEEWRRKISKSRKRFTDEEELSFRDRWLSGETKSSIAKDIGVHITTITRAIERAERFNY